MKLQKPPSCIYIPKCIFLFQVEPRVLFSKRIPSTFSLFVFETFGFGNSLFVSRLLTLFGTIQKKITCAAYFSESDNFTRQED